MSASDIIERFRKLVDGGRPRLVEGPPEPPPPDPDADFKSAIASLSDGNRGAILAWLARHADEANMRAHAARMQHAEVAYALGNESALHFVINALKF